MPKHIDTQGTFDITGEISFVNAGLQIFVGSTLPTIVTANGQLFMLQTATKNRLYWTVDGSWYYKDAV